MTAQDKFNEANHFLKLINEELPSENLELVRYYTSACLTSIRSITDHTVFEAKEKYNVQFREDEWVTIDQLRKKCDIQRITSSIGFFMWYSIEIEKLENNRFSNLMRDITNKNVHDKEIRYNIRLLFRPHGMKSYEQPIFFTLYDNHFDNRFDVILAAGPQVDEHVAKLNAIRQEKGDDLITGRNYDMYIVFPETDTLLRFNDALKFILEIMKIWVDSFTQFKKDNW